MKWPDNDSGEHPSVPDVDVTREVGDANVGAQVVVQHGSRYSSGHVVCRKSSDGGSVQGTLKTIQY